MYLAVTIDTEEDNWGEYDRSSYSVQNVTRIPRLQEIFAKHGVRPTYLITHPVATSARAVELLRMYHQENLCEIGTHLHPWNTPPLEERRTQVNSFLNNLPARLQYRKIETLHQTIAKNFGVEPRSFRSGRWGFSEDVARGLIRLGYAVDTSLYPATDWSPCGGPDYRECRHEPFVYRVGHDAHDGALLEVPATIDFLQSRRGLANSAYWAVKRTLPAADTILAVLNRARLLNHVCLSPELCRADGMIRLAATLLRRGTRIVNMFFHSPSLLPGCSPFVKTEGDASAFLERIDRFLAFARSAGLRPVSMSELKPEDVGATAVRVLKAA
ncbi:MAG TPA: hypothetical protein VK886_06485 [Vicinamibacterales bacterium]|nr:hypothetical protein [Vicinamibacterales bacterium]